MVMTLPLLLSAVSVDFFTGGPRPYIGFMKTCCTIVPWPGSAFSCGTWLINDGGRSSSNAGARARRAGSSGRTSGGGWGGRTQTGRTGWERERGHAVEAITQQSARFAEGRQDGRLC